MTEPTKPAGWRNPCPVCGAKQPPCAPGCGFQPADEDLKLPAAEAPFPAEGCVCDPPSHSGHYSYCPLNALGVDPPSAQRKHLVLHVEIPGFWADDLDQCAGALSGTGVVEPEDRLFVVTEEWMREEVGITLVSLPGEKNLSDDFEVHAYTGRIVGAETREVSGG